ncbi:hypothetical protein SLA2020_406930 [Shorea laevis]
MEDFRVVLDDCHFSDLGYTRSKFTWCNAREDSSFTKERLDQACCKFLLVRAVSGNGSIGPGSSEFRPLSIILHQGVMGRRTLIAATTSNLRLAGWSTRHARGLLQTRGLVV